MFDFDNAAYDSVLLGQAFGFTIMQFPALNSTGTGGDFNESLTALPGESIAAWCTRVGDGTTICVHTR